MDSYIAKKSIKITEKFTLEEGSIFNVLPYRGKHADTYIGDVQLVAGRLKYDNTYGTFYDTVMDKYHIISKTSKLNTTWLKDSGFISISEWNSYLESFNQDCTKLDINKLLNSSCIYHKALTHCRKDLVHNLRIDALEKEVQKLKSQSYINKTV